MENMDEASQAAIITLLLHDTEDIFDASIDTHVDSDLQLALSLWQEEIDNYANVAEDRRIAERIASAPRRGRGNRTVVRGRGDERATASWRRLAAGKEVDLLGSDPPAQAQAKSSEKSVAPQKQPELEPEPEHERDPPKPNPLRCISCSEIVAPDTAIKTPCSHHHCRTCVLKLVQLLLENETTFAPQCCHTEIPLTLLQPIFDSEPDIKRQFDEKVTYHNDSNRTYCSNSTCVRYLGPNTKSPGTNMGYCVGCLRWTCVTCQKTHVPWMGCQFGDEEVLQWVKEWKWQQCLQCKHWVELEAGCNHVVCRCGNGFCYECGAKWKSCDCELHRYFGRA
ncbi:hypothetical protein SI65_07042 [Aspergillus cristatus]|uniref:RING-type domain-containing protein n=1 Tax=Aspergillus cristatus TaxID=573508 RepID=A0A1E3B8U5_ASPCR|nr:hypothetical protein SI65_07042 [Aspergillus cristatus]